MSSRPQQERHLIQSLGRPPLIFSTAAHNSPDASTHATLVQDALKAGFSAIDASNDERFPHREEWAGHGIREAIRSQGLKREHVFIMTTCGWALERQWDEEEHGIAEKAIEKHVHASTQASLRNLRHQADPGASESKAYIDLVVLDGPPSSTYSNASLSPTALDAMMLAAWRALCSYHPRRIRHLGVRNFANLKCLASLCANAAVKPALALRSFTPAGHWDLPMRTFCARAGITYAAESVSAAVNQGLLDATPVALLEGFAGVEKGVAVVAFLTAMGVPVVVGEAEEREGVRRVERWSREKEDSWVTLRDDFVHLVRM